MIFRKVSLLTTLLLIAVLGCEHTKSVLQPVDTIVPLSPEMSQTLMQRHWWVTTIDGAAISENLSQLKQLVAEHVSDEMDISFYRTNPNPIFQFQADGTWRLDVSYHLFCERYPELDHNADFSSSEPENISIVYINLSVGGSYVAGYDTEKQSNVLIFETEKLTQVTIYHENPYDESDLTCIPEYPCDLNIFPPFTADLDWRIFEDEPLSKIFSSPLFDTETDTPVVYTWDMVTTVDAGVHYTIRLYSQGQEDIILGRTDEVLD